MERRVIEVLQESSITRRVGHRDRSQHRTVADCPDPPLTQMEHLAMGGRWVTAGRKVEGGQQGRVAA